MFDTTDPVILFRMAERLTLTFVVMVMALVVMIGFWRTVQSIDLRDGGKLGVTGSFVFSTPVFALLVVVGYAYVSLSHPIRVDAPPAVTPMADEEVAAGPSAGGGFVGASGPAAAADPDYTRTVAQRRIRSLNCLAQAQSPSARVSDDLAQVKLDLMAPVWTADWGAFSAFSDWAQGRADGPPDPDAEAVYSARHVLC